LKEEKKDQSYLIREYKPKSVELEGYIYLKTHQGTKR